MGAKISNSDLWSGYSIEKGKAIQGQMSSHKLTNHSIYRSKIFIFKLSFVELRTILLVISFKKLFLSHNEYDSAYENKVMVCGRNCSDLLSANIVMCKVLHFISVI